MRPADVIRRASDYLGRHGVDSPSITAEIIMSSVLGLDRASIYSRSDPLTAAQSRDFGRALCVRCSGVPIQHITGEQGFRRLVLRVRPGVFVPRPETEVTVDVGLKAIAHLDRPVVVDVGTGSGAIATSIADEHPGARVLATDLSDEALYLARENAHAADVEVEMFQGDLLEPLPTELAGELDLVISNPPYVPADAVLPPDVAAEPALALFGGPDLFARLAVQAANWLRPGGAIVLEIEESSALTVSRILVDAGFSGVGVTRDLAGRDRVVSAVK